VHSRKAQGAAKKTAKNAARAFREEVKAKRYERVGPLAEV
jgi:hypothetical protein